MITKHKIIAIDNNTKQYNKTWKEITQYIYTITHKDLEEDSYIIKKEVEDALRLCPTDSPYYRPIKHPNDIDWWLHAIYDHPWYYRHTKIEKTYLHILPEQDKIQLCEYMYNNFFKEN